MSKKIVFSLLCVLLLFGVTACGGKKTELSENNRKGNNELKNEITDKELVTATNDAEDTVITTEAAAVTETVESTPFEEKKDTQEETGYLNSEEYGAISETQKKFYSHIDKEQEVYHYTIEQFFFHKEYKYSVIVNQALTKIYEDYAEAEEECGEERRNNTAEEYKAGMGVEYGSLLFSKLTYVGEKYISICFNNVAYLGGAHPYTYQVSYTIDVLTGKVMDAEDILGKSKKEILAQNPELQSWPDGSEEIYGYGSYYLTKDNLVFYRGLLNTGFEEVYIEYKGE